MDQTMDLAVRLIRNSDLKVHNRIVLMLKPFHARHIVSDPVDGFFKYWLQMPMVGNSNRDLATPIN